MSTGTATLPIGALIGTMFGCGLIAAGVAGLYMPDVVPVSPTIAWTLVVIGAVVDVVATLRLVQGARRR